jgi:hypothetical protein
MAGVLLSLQAQACGPFFSPILVTDRQAHMAYLPEGDVYVQLSHLLPAKEAALVADEATEVSEVEVRDLSAEQAAQLKALRASADPASEAGNGLPEDIRLYAQGAVAFNLAWPMTQRGEAEGEEMQASTDTTMALTDTATAGTNTNAAAIAREKFLAIMALPDAAKKSRALWASFMLGRVASLEGDDKQAANYFSQVRQLAALGYKDDLGLAVTTYGLEARPYYLMATGQHPLVDGITQAQAYQKALQLYAKQAAYNAPSAYQSLRMTIEHLMERPDAVAQLADDKFTQQLIFAYAFSGYFSDKARLDLLASLERQQQTDIPDPDVAAAFAYRQGRSDLAAHFVAKSSTPLAAWVKAKLALQQGDSKLALDAYVQAAKAFPLDENWNASNPEPDDYMREGVTPNCRINSELGLLQLQRSEYVQALHYLYLGAKEYWMDAAYVAERVVTTDELKTFVDQLAPAADGSSAHVWGEANPPAQIRNLLARRLMRDQRYQEAIPYFADQELQQKAREYASQLMRAQTLWLPAAYKAEALFAASQLARYSGMELMGYEGAPDYAAWDGMFEFGWTEDLNAGGVISAGEKQRFELSKAKPEKRFHYRFVAAQLASQAADQLPPRSQAFAAVLCEATHYLLVRYPQDAAPYYQRYLKQGAYLPWGARFGQECPAPDFKLAFWQYPREKLAQLKRHF